MNEIINSTFDNAKKEIKKIIDDFYELNPTNLYKDLDVYDGYLSYSDNLFVFRDLPLYIDNITEKINYVFFDAIIDSLLGSLSSIYAIKVFNADVKKQQINRCKIQFDNKIISFVSISRFFLDQYDEEEKINPVFNKDASIISVACNIVFKGDRVERLLNKKDRRDLHFCSLYNFCREYLESDDADFLLDSIMTLKEFTDNYLNNNKLLQTKCMFSLLDSSVNDKVEIDKDLFNKVIEEIDLYLLRCKLSDDNWLKTFNTSEWLFSRFSYVKGIDNTFIVASYLKSMEQLLVWCLKKNYDTYKLKLANRKNNENELMLGEIIEFIKKQSSIVFNKYPKLKSIYLDLLISWKNKDRNGFFHKHSINSYETITKIRKDTIDLIKLTLFIYLGQDYLDKIKLQEFRCSRCGTIFKEYSIKSLEICGECSTAEMLDINNNDTRTIINSLFDKLNEMKKK